MTDPGRQPSRWIWGLVAAAALLPYLRLPSLPLVYDAPAAVLRNEVVQHGSAAGVFTVDFWGDPLDAEYSTRSYRPLVSLSWLLQVRALGDSPQPFHLIDMALHALAALLVVALGETLGLRRAWAVIAGAAFAVHPVVTEAVSSVVGRADVLAGVLLLAALLLHLRQPVGFGTELASWSCLAAALLSKEYAVAFPFILAGVDVARAGGVREAASRRWRFWLAAAALLAAYLALRLSLTGALGGVPMLAAADHPLVDAPLLTRLAMAARLLLLAARLLVLPLWLNHHYRAGTLEIVDSPWNALSLAGAALVVGSLAWAWWWSVRRRQAVPLSAWLLVVGPLLPALNVITLAGVVFAERYLYVPAAGFALALAWAVEQATGPRPLARRAAGAALGVLLATGVVLGARRVPDWGSDERLARSSLASYPAGSEVWRDLGLAMGAEGRHAEALDAFERSLEIEPRAPQTWRAYATALVNLGRYEEGAEAWRQCIERTPGETPPALSRGLGEALLYSARNRLAAGDASGALSQAGQIAQVGGIDGDLLVSAGRLAEVAGDPELARDLAARALAQNAALPGELGGIALSLEREGRFPDAAEAYRTYLLLVPDDPAALAGLGRALIRSGRPAEAVEPLRRSNELRPDDRTAELLEHARAAAR